MSLDLDAINNTLVKANVQSAMKAALRDGQSIVPAALLRKGDEPGHEFRGNQYSGGGGGGMPSARAMAAESKARNDAARGDAKQQAKDKASDVKDKEKFKAETKAAHDTLTSSGFTRDPANDIKGREGMRAYTNAKGDRVMQSSGLAIHTTAGGKKTVMNSSKELASHLSRGKKLDPATLRKIHNHTTGEWRVEDDDGRVLGKFASEVEADALMKGAAE